MSELKDRWFWAYPTESVDCDGITGSAHEVYSKSDVDAAIDELKTENESLLQQNRELCLALQVMYSKEEYDKQKAKADKLLSCLKCLVMRDLIKDCPPKEVATEIVKEYDNGLG